MKSIDVCLSPDLLHLYEVKGKMVVVVDILRATSCMTTALAEGVEEIVPVATLEECQSLGKQGYVTAAERDGKKADGFDLGNSPFSYRNGAYRGQKIAVTTTNGTYALTKSKEAEVLVAGSFLNIGAICGLIKEANLDTIILCAGWKGKVNLEDSLFAGAVCARMSNHLAPACDAPLMAKAMYEKEKGDMMGFLKESSHVKRLQGLNIHEDIAFCLEQDVYSAIPIYKNNRLVKA